MNNLKCLILIFILSCSNKLYAQLLTVSPGINLTISSGTIFSVDSLSLIPAADFVISNNALNKFATVSHATPNNYIARVYRFANNSNPFTGSVQINYRDGVELNGIVESHLTLNAYNGTAWLYHPADYRDAINNFVLTGNLVALTLNELTLAHLDAPLPVSWLSFTAAKQNKTALLKWATAQEQNTRNFTVQHSANGISWAGISILPAAGNSNTTRNYSYVHSNPINGVNYYRILQTDINNSNSYSVVRTLKFSAADEQPFIIIGNPVTNKILTLQVNKNSSLALYNSDGKLLWQQQVNTGTKTFDMSRYAKGIYFLNMDNSSEKIVLQ